MSEAQPTRAAHAPGRRARALLGAGVVLGAILIFALLKATAPKSTRVPIDEDAARTVRVLPVRAVAVDRMWEGFGTARALRAADISAEVAGVVVERPERIEPGAALRAGDLIIAIDPADYERQLARAEGAAAALDAELAQIDVEERSIRHSIELAQRETELMRRELARLRDAAARAAANVTDVERLERELSRIEREERAWLERLELVPARRARVGAQHGVEQAAAEMARHDLARTRIVAPFDGSLQDALVRAGERVAVGARVARVVDLRRMEVPLNIPVSAGALVRVGDEAELRADGPIGGAWTGRIVRVAPEADARTRTVAVFVEITQDPARRAPDAPPPLLPGQFVTGRVFTPDAERRIVVPRLALNADRVLVEDDTGHVAARTVRVLHFIERALPEVDPRETQWAVLASGLRPGERVIVSNLDELEVGMRIGAVEATASAPSDASRPPAGAAP